MWALHPPEVGIRLVPRSGYLRPLSLLRRAPPQPSNLRRVEGRPLCGTATLALAITALARGQQRRFRAALRAVDIESLEVVDVLCEEEGPVQIRMRWPKGGESRMFNRPRDQLLDKTLMRMSLTLQKGSNTKAKRRGWRQRKQHKEVEQKKVEPPKTITMSLLTNDGQPLDGSLQLEEAFAAETKAAILLAGEESYRVRINRPMARHVTCRGRPRAGLRLAAVAQGCFCDSQKLRWEWLVGGELVSREHCYTPTEAQVGQALEVIARPPLAADPKTSLLLGVDDLEASAQLELPAVQPQAALPGQCDTRSQAMDAQLQTWLESQDKAPNTLRVVSYNALADCYRHCWDQMFPYCQPETLRPEQRLQLIRQEVSTFRADLLGMQEVDATGYKEYWQPQFAADGFGSCFTKKVSDSLEGCLLVYKEEALELLEIRERPLRDLFRRRVSPPESTLEEVTSLPSMDAAIGALVGKLPALDDVFPRLGTVAQLALFRSRKDSSQLLLVCNTHLYFANYARHIRVLQAALLLAEAESMAVSAVEKFGHRPGLLFMGDLNSTPDTAVVELLRRGFVSAGHPDWATCAAFRWGYASSRQAAKDMLAALRSDDRASAFRDLVVDDEGLEALMSLRATTERLMRVRASLATLGLGQASEVAEEEQAEVAEVHEAVSDTAASAWERLEERLQAKGTFKNSAVVATAQLALDLRLSNEPVLEFSEEDLERVMAATEELTAAVSQKVKNAIETQKALSEAELGSSTGAALAGIGLQLESPFRLLSTYDPAPEFTNFVGNYEACLDWIFFEGDHFHKVSEAAVPPREDLEAETALPSTVFPSDHILLAADFAWQAAAKKRKQSLLHLLAELLERVGRVADLSQSP